MLLVCVEWLSWQITTLKKDTDLENKVKTAIFIPLPHSRNSYQRSRVLTFALFVNSSLSSENNWLSVSSVTENNLEK